MTKLLKSLFLLLFIVMNIVGFSTKLMADNTNYVAERGDMEHRNMDMNHNDFENRDNFNRNNYNKNDFNAGAAYGANRGAQYGAAYGAAAGNANSNAGAVPMSPNAAQQNALYYGETQNMLQGQ